MLRILMVFICVLGSNRCLASNDAKTLRTYVTTLASDDMMGRRTGSPGFNKAAKYIEEQCIASGLPIVEQPVKNIMARRENVVSIVHSKNIMTYIKGKNPYRIIVIGAHLDHIGMNRRGRVFNGADDNASGSAAVLLLAQRFAKGPQPNMTLLFQWYTGEELGLIGSRYYVAHPVFPKVQPHIMNHYFMLNLDMVGRLRYTTPGYCDIDLPKILNRLFTTYPFAKRITFKAGENSDHAAFMKYKIPVVFLHTGLHRDYHRTTDDADKINYAGLVKICDYAEAMIKEVDKGDRLVPYIIWGASPDYVPPILQNGVVDAK